MSDQTIPRFEQIESSVLPYQYNVNPFANAHSLTVDTITAASSDVTNVTIGDEVVQNGLWDANLTAISGGSSTITLTTTFVNSNVVRKRKFKVMVTDP